MADLFCTWIIDIADDKRTSIVENDVQVDEELYADIADQMRCNSEEEIMDFYRKMLECMMLVHGYVRIQ